MSIHDIVVTLCESRGIKKTQLEKELGLGQGTIGKWKKNKPKTDTLQKVADYFGVSVDYLMTGKEYEKKSNNGTKYYFNDETAQMAQDIFDRPYLKILMSASRDLSADSVKLLAEMAERMKGTNPNG